MKSLKSKLAVGIFLFLSIKTYAQDNSVGVNVLSDQVNPNAVLHLVSPNSNQGLLIPQLTTDQRNAMVPNLDDSSNGLIVFDNEESQFYFWMETAWRAGLGVINDLNAAGDLEGTWPTLNIRDEVITNDMITDAIIGSEKLAATGITPGDYGTANGVLQVTVNDAGQITAITEIPVAISTAEIINGTILEEDLADGAITSVKILDETIATEDVADDAITNDKIADDAINSAKVEDNSLLPSDILGTLQSGTGGQGMMVSQSGTYTVGPLNFFIPEWFATAPDQVLTTNNLGQFLWEPRSNFSSIALLGGQIFVGGGGAGANEAVALTVNPGAIIVGDVGQVVQRTVGGAVNLDGATGNMTLQSVVAGDGLNYTSGTFGQINIGGGLSTAQSIDLAGFDFSFVNTNPAGGGDFTLNNSTRAIDVDGGAITIDALSASSLNVFGNDLDVSTTGGGNLDLTGAVDVNVTGGINVDVLANSGDINMTANTASVAITGNQAIADAVRIDAPSGGVDVNGNQGVTIDAANNDVDITGNANVDVVATTGNVNLNASNANSDITFTANDQVTFNATNTDIAFGTFELAIGGIQVNEIVDDASVDVVVAPSDSRLVTESALANVIGGQAGSGLTFDLVGDDAIDLGGDLGADAVIGTAGNTFSVESLATAGDSYFSVADGGAVTIGNAGVNTSVDVDATNANISLTTNTSGSVDIDGVSGVNIDGTGPVNIATAGSNNDGAVNIGTSTSSGRAITIGNSTGATDVDINSGSGGVAVVANGGNVDIDADAASNFSTTSGAITIAGNDGVNITSTSSTGVNIDANSSGDVEINAANGQILIGNDAVNRDIDIGTAGNRTIDIGATAGTTAVNVGAGSGGVTVDSNGGNVAIDADAASNFSTSSGDITISGNDGVNITSTTANGVIVDANTAGNVEINAAAGQILIGDDAVNQNINLGTGGDRTITIGATGGATGVNLMPALPASPLMEKGLPTSQLTELTSLWLLPIPATWP